MRTYSSAPFLLGLCVLLTSCASLQTATKPAGVLHLKESKFAETDGWSDDRQNEALTAFSQSCERILKADPSKAMMPDNKAFGTYADWQTPCRALPEVVGNNPDTIRTFFETWFTPYLAADNGKTDGLFTGYYEPALRGSPVRGGAYQIPLRARPDDLVSVNLSEFRPELKGIRIAGRVKDGQLKPYDDRAAIENGKMPTSADKPLFWVESAVDAFFLQIQGSGVILLPDGNTQRIGYDGQNGYPYTAIGKELIERGELTKDTVSMQSIKAWLAAHPQDATALMQKNKSYIFFRKLDTYAPVGAEGLPLTTERSLAVDHTIWPYGIPLFLSVPDENIRRLVVAQDTGGAITGVVRGDLFWGFGETAEKRAGSMKAPGRMWVLLPRSITPQPTS